MTHTDRVAIVTGGSQGIGFAAAERLLAEGMRVALLARDPARLEDARTRLGAPEGRLFAHSCDVADEKSVAAAVDDTLAHFGGLDVLVNSAGVSMRGRDRLDETTTEDWRRIIETNLTGTYFMIRACLPALKRSPAADILNVQSTASFAGTKGVSLYAASKFGVRALTEALIEEHRGTALRITAVSPGPVATSIWDHKREPPPAETRAKMLQPADLADIVFFLLDRPRHVHIPNITVTPWVAG